MSVQMIGASVLAAVLLWRVVAPAHVQAATLFPVRLVLILASWRGTADACGLAGRRRRRVFRHRRLRLLYEEPRFKVLPPRLRRARPTRYGWTAILRLRPGQTPDDVVQVADRLAHSWRCHAVRVVPERPGRVRLYVSRRDPLRAVKPATSADQLLRPCVGRLDTGARWVLDFRTVPHYLVAGATNSGKSTLLNALVARLAPQPVVLVGFDLKGGRVRSSVVRREALLFRMEVGVLRRLVVVAAG
jgi:DNA segregation ATPase FtsK/SpoIIIE, S-DNA-T family